MKKFLLITHLFILLMILFSCKQNEDALEACDYEMTTIQYTLTPTSGDTSIVLEVTDLDGDGLSPTITPGTLVSNERYQGEISILGELPSSTIDLTSKILEDSEDFQFFYRSTISDLEIIYNDEDLNGFPIGMSIILETGSVGEGELEIILRELPVKNALGVKDGDITNAQGETAFAISIPITVQ